MAPDRYNPVNEMQSPLDLDSSRFGSGSSLSTMGQVTSNLRNIALPLDPRQNPQTGLIITKIEEILIANIDALRENRALTIPIRNRRTGNLRLVRFPSSRDTEAKKFTALLQILHLSHESLVAGTVITKRAIYYQNPELFGAQQYVNELVDDIAFTFGVGRDALNIVAASKGLVAGGISVTINGRSIFNCSSDDGQGVLLPDVRAITGVNLGAIKWLLVVEKEAAFRGLVASRFHETATVGPGVLITAKGYPDLSTRQFLHKLHTASPTLPMYGLVDFDPHGVDIMLTYKNGSQSLQHEENTTSSQLIWIGLRSNDVLGHHQRRSQSSHTNQTCNFSGNPSPQLASLYSGASPSLTGNSSPKEAILPLKALDRRLAVRILSMAIGKDHPLKEGLDLIHELQIMLLLNTKAEIEAVDEAGDLTTWLDSTLTQRMDGR
ncbi:Spo11/DNA topoisomerase VI subunit A [Xylaria telfairii]|nr:Spo11/DNA topoisomerase VI subunit A [Xylaria telfairii]